MAGSDGHRHGRRHVTTPEIDASSEGARLREVSIGVRKVTSERWENLHAAVQCRRLLPVAAGDLGGVRASQLPLSRHPFHRATCVVIGQNCPITQDPTATSKISFAKRDLEGIRIEASTIHLHRNWHLKHSPTWALVSLFSCRISKRDLPQRQFPRRWDHGLFHRPRTTAKRAFLLDLVNFPNITAEISIKNVRSLSVRYLVLARHISNPLFQNPDRPCFPTIALERANFRMSTHP